mmetsp:Transcript_43950/g.80311  ORF Transcript_43950/g.80311 Transcript_43950/m.80311 type:complete len:127 (-) Transcript_43950:57-437(-)
MARHEEDNAGLGDLPVFEEVVAATTLVPVFLEIQELAVHLWPCHRRIKEILKEKRVWTALCLRHWPSLAEDASFNWAWSKTLFRKRFEKKKKEERDRKRNQPRHRNADLHLSDGVPPTQGLIIQIQ